MSLTVKIKYFGDMKPLVKKGDWIDLRCAETTEIKAGEVKLIPLGVAMKLPSGYEAIIASRSSTHKKYNVIMADSIGIIDEDFCGPNDEWKYPALALKDTVIPKDERIAQFRIIKHQPSIDFEFDDLESETDRGGFGSTGRV